MFLFKQKYVYIFQNLADSALHSLVAMCTEVGNCFGHINWLLYSVCYILLVVCFKALPLCMGVSLTSLIQTSLRDFSA